MTNLQEKFDSYDKENPAVWTAFVRFTLELIRAGCKHYSSDGILHKIRFETAVSGNDSFKINNSYSPYYARKFMLHYPQHNKFFETRTINKAA